jgi:hypothetical protein
LAPCSFKKTALWPTLHPKSFSAGSPRPKTVQTAGVAAKLEAKYETKSIRARLRNSNKKTCFPKFIVSCQMVSENRHFQPVFTSVDLYWVWHTLIHPLLK